MQRAFLVALLAVAALAVAFVGWFVGGLALVLGALAGLIFSATRGALLILLAVGLLAAVVGLAVTRVNPDECFGECIEIGAWGFDPFLLVFAVVNFVAWSLGLFLGRVLRPVVRRPDRTVAETSER